MSGTEFCELHEAEYMEVLLHVSVRWLSLERCVTRILRLYEPLASYFKSAGMVIIYLFHYAATTWIVSHILVLLITSCFVLVIDWFKMKTRPGSRGLCRRSLTPWQKCTCCSFNPPFQLSLLSTCFFKESGHQYLCCMMRWDWILQFFYSVSCWYLQGSSKTCFTHYFVNVCYRWRNLYASFVQSSLFQQLCRALRSLVTLPLGRRQTICQVSDWLLLWSNTVLCDQ